MGAYLPLLMCQAITVLPRLQQSVLLNSPLGRLDLLWSEKAGDNPSTRHWLLQEGLRACLTVNLHPVTAC